MVGIYFRDERGRSCFRPSVPPIPGIDDVADVLAAARHDVATFDRRLSASGPSGSVGRLFARLDAVHSSGAEGTTTTFTDLLEYQSIPEAVRERADAESVAAVAASLETEAGGSNPTAAILRIHERLFSRDPSRFKAEGAGRFKSSPNAVSDFDEPTGFFHYTHPDQVPAALAEWKAFTMDADPAVPELVRQVLSHWMFESIHPVQDGNGRIGRLLVPLVLRWKGVTSNACVFFGEAVHEQKDLYLHALKSVRASGDATGCCRILLAMIGETARANAERLDRVEAIAADWRSRVSGYRSDSTVHGMVSWALTKPVFNVLDAARELGTSFVSANNAVDVLVKEGIVSNPGGAARNRLFAADAVLDVFDRFRRPSPDTGYAAKR